MRVALYIAKRYLFAKKSKNVVHFVSLASMIGVAVGTAALVLVLSVFNGFEQLILSLYNSFDPPIKVSVLEGKVSDFSEAKMYLDEKNILYSEVLEEKVLLRYQEKEYIATLKGVDDNFKRINSIDSLLIAGEYMDVYDSKNTAIVGQGVAYYLSMRIGNAFQQLQVYVPDREKNNLLRPENSFIQKSILPVGIFTIQSDFDAEYVIAPISFIRDILNREGQSSSLEIKCSDAEMAVIQADLKQILGSQFEVKNRFEQHAFLYKILSSEKLAVFLILTFILIIATFNIIGSLTMLLIEKKKDIELLFNLGANRRLIKNIFFYEGVLTTALGAVIGLFFGLLVAYLQIYFGIVKMGEGSFVVDSYPVVVEFVDVVLVLVVVLAIGSLASLIPSSQLSKKLL
ncbi:FtsX-like permease family protein [Flavobacteriales bacterium]|nr:FtsX-like permease family protein [Flavobacteriales bacterium]MDA7794335.1 FtsX-like permease family protein [Flavobacteriales bacterium]